MVVLKELCLFLFLHRRKDLINRMLNVPIWEVADQNAAAFFFQPDLRMHTAFHYFILCFQE